MGEAREVLLRAYELAGKGLREKQRRQWRVGTRVEEEEGDGEGEWEVEATGRLCCRPPGVGTTLGNDKLKTSMQESRR